MTDAAPPPTFPSCPVSGHAGIPVPKAVLHSMLPSPRKSQARDGYAFCTGQTCEIAYFDIHQGAHITTKELNKPISIKNENSDAMICYCLQVTRGQIAEGVRSGVIQSSEDAKATTMACTGNACHIVNPAGICCGDQLRDAVVTVLVETHASPEVIQHAQTEDPGATCCGRTLDKVLRGQADDGCCATAPSAPKPMEKK